MLAGSLTSSPYIAYTATEYSVLGDSPSSRTSGWATFTCQYRDALGYPPMPSTEQDLTETQVKVPLVALRGLHHLGRCSAVVKCSASLPKGHQARWGYTSPSPALVCRGVSPSYRGAAAVAVVLGWIRGRVRDVIPLRSDTWKALAEELPAAGRPIAAGLLPPAANTARPQLSSYSLLTAEMHPSDFQEPAHNGAQFYERLGMF